MENKIKQKYIILMAGLCLLFWAGISLHADVVYLKDGRKVEGHIIDQNRNIIRFRKTNGRITVFTKSIVKRVTYGKVASSNNKNKEQAALRKKRERQRELALLQKEQAAEQRIKAEEKLAEEKLAEEKLLLALANKKQQALDKKAADEISAERSNAKRVAEEKRLAEPERKRNTSDTRGGPDAIGALWRSALLPGWGQWARGEKLAGGMFAAGTILGSFALYETNRVYRATAHDLDSLGNPLAVIALVSTTSQIPAISDPVFFTLYNQPFIARRAKLESQLQNQRIAGAAIAFVYTWNLIDAFFFHPGKTASSHFTAFERSLASKGSKNSNSELNLDNKIKSSEDWSFYPVLIRELQSASTGQKRSSVRHELHFTRKIQF